MIFLLFEIHCWMCFWEGQTDFSWQTPFHELPDPERALQRASVPTSLEHVTF